MKAETKNIFSKKTKKKKTDNKRKKYQIDSDATSWLFINANQEMGKLYIKDWAIGQNFNRLINNCKC